jgi:hypothetical protein
VTGSHGSYDFNGILMGFNGDSMVLWHLMMDLMGLNGISWDYIMRCSWEFHEIWFHLLGWNGIFHGASCDLMGFSGILSLVNKVK